MKSQSAIAILLMVSSINCKSLGIQKRVSEVDSMAVQESSYPPTRYYYPASSVATQSAPSHRYQPSSYSSSPIVYNYHVMGSKLLYGSPHQTVNQVAPAEPKTPAPYQHKIKTTVAPVAPVVEPVVDVKIEEIPVVETPADIIIEPIEVVVESATDSVVEDTTDIVDVAPVVIEISTDATVDIPVTESLTLKEEVVAVTETPVDPVVEEVAVTTTTAAPASSPLPVHKSNHPSSYRRSGPPRRAPQPSPYGYYRPGPSYHYPRPTTRSSYRPYYPRY